MKTPVRIVLAEDHEVVRDAFRLLLQSKEGLVVVGEARTGREAVDLVRTTAPHVVVMDVNLPELNGIEAARQIHADAPGVQIIGLSVHTQGAMISEMLKAGARAYLPKRCASRELFDAIRAVLDGKIYLSPEVTEDLLHDERQRVMPGQKLSAFSRLTDREKEVLQLLAEGFPSKEIATMLGVSTTTIHTHRQHLLEKLNARTVADLTRYAIREGLASLDP
jgi:DNA-binding NarL/FixJ family response regulator